MKYLITGGAGYIGSHMVNFLKKTNSEITILDNLSTGHSYNIIDCEFINLDLRDKDKLFKKLHKRKFDGVFHFAGKSIVSESLIDPKSYYENNIIGTNNLLELIVKNDLNNFIFSSSAAVYGNTNVDLISEDHTKMYSSKKSEGGGVLLDLIHEIDLAYWLFGKTHKIKSFLSNTKTLNIRTEDVANIISAPPFAIALIALSASGPYLTLSIKVVSTLSPKCFSISCLPISCL